MDIWDDVISGVCVVLGATSGTILGISEAVVETILDSGDELEIS